MAVTTVVKTMTMTGALGIQGDGLAECGQNDEGHRHWQGGQSTRCRLRGKRGKVPCTSQLNGEKKEVDWVSLTFGVELWGAVCQASDTLRSLVVSVVGS